MNRFIVFSSFRCSCVFDTGRVIWYFVVFSLAFSLSLRFIFKRAARINPWCLGLCWLALLKLFTWFFFWGSLRLLCFRRVCHL